MSNIKTILLTGDEQEVQVSGTNCDIRNDGVDTVYASRSSGITAGADGVLSIPSGQAAKLLDTGGRVYLTGTGSVQVCGNDYDTMVFKSALGGGGGSGVDQTARDAINAHAGNTDIHLTAADVAAIASNGNALINSNFRINQRGKSEYAYDSSTRGYTVDMWQLVCEGNMLTVLDDGVKLGYVSGSSPTLPSHMLQGIENYADYAGCTVTAQAYIEETTSAYPQLLIVYKKDGANHHKNMKAAAGLNTISFDIPEDITGLEVWLYGADVRTGDTADSYSIIKWVMLEKSEASTAYPPPVAALEIVKCLWMYSFIGTYLPARAAAVTTNFIDFVVPVPLMRLTPSIVGTLEVVDITTNTSVDGFTFTAIKTAPNGVLIRAAKDNHGLTDATLVTKTGAALSAEL